MSSSVSVGNRRITGTSFVHWNKQVLMEYAEQHQIMWKVEHYVFQTLLLKPLSDVFLADWNQFLDLEPIGSDYPFHLRKKHPTDGSIKPLSMRVRGLLQDGHGFTVDVVALHPCLDVLKNLRGRVLIVIAEA